MATNIKDSINDEIEKKNRILFACPQHTSVIARPIKTLDSLHDRGRLVDPTDSQVLKYLKFIRAGRSSTDNSASVISHGQSPFRSTCPVGSSDNVTATIAEIQSLMDDGYSRLQMEITDIRRVLFSTCEELREVKALEPPTASIEREWKIDGSGRSQRATFTTGKHGCVQRAKRMCTSGSLGISQITCCSL
jgi:hypothetical protein